MKIVLATGNQGKIKEFKKMLPDSEILTYKELIGEIEIIEDKNTFKENAIKKVKTIYNELEDRNYKNFLVIADDSGISLPILNNEPGVYSARYAGNNSTDKDNNAKLIKKLKDKKLNEAKAYYTACIAIAYKNEFYTVHGWMHGKVITCPKGENGFGYDPLFIPDNYSKTVGELNSNIKSQISHRGKALKLAKYILDVIVRH